MERLWARHFPLENYKTYLSDIALCLNIDSNPIKRRQYRLLNKATTNSLLFVSKINKRIVLITKQPTTQEEERRNVKQVSWTNYHAYESGDTPHMSYDYQEQAEALQVINPELTFNSALYYQFSGKTLYYVLFILTQHHEREDTSKYCHYKSIQRKTHYPHLHSGLYKPSHANSNSSH